MSYKNCSLIIGVVLALLAPVSSQAATILADNFNEYTNASYIGTQTPVQTNPGGAFGIAGNWTRFGGATTDGIYSIAGGAEGRGASYSVAWTPTAVAGYTMYTFSAVQNLSLLSAITLDINVGTVVAGTTVSVQLRSGATTFQSVTPLALTNTTFSTFTFDSTSSGLSRIEGSGTYASTLAAVNSIVFVFSNAGGTGSQSIRFDNFNLATVPEPSTVVAMGIAGMVLVGGRFLRRRRQG